MGISEFEDAYEEDDPNRRTDEEQRLGEAILNAPIRALDPSPAAQLPETATIREAIGLMLERGIGAVLAVREGRVVGIFTERDVLRRVAVSGIDPARPLKDVMTPDPEALSLDDGIAFALNRMTVGGFRNVPILDESGAAIAILSQREVVAYIVSLLPRRILNLPPEPRLEAHSADGG
jgi:signal-transduction protein with cAMP-binding, CBS, and nucleotidyltransferase domain